jgi:uncharacterized protein (TIGR00369 family)
MKEQEKTQNKTGFPPSNLPRDPETGYFLDIPARIREIYKHNCFMSDYFHINIDEIHCGSAQVSLHIERAKHANHRNVVHGGALTALADSVLGVTGASVGEAVVTVSFSMNFISNTSFDGTVRMISHIKHHGRTTMVITGEMYDENDRLIATMMTSMMNVDKIEGIPRKW